MQRNLRFYCEDLALLTSLTDGQFEKEHFVLFCVMGFIYYFWI